MSLLLDVSDHVCVETSTNTAAKKSSVVNLWSKGGYRDLDNTYPRNLTSITFNPFCFISSSSFSICRTFSSLAFCSPSRLYLQEWRTFMSVCCCSCTVGRKYLLQLNALAEVRINDITVIVHYHVILSTGI